MLGVCQSANQPVSQTSIPLKPPDPQTPDHFQTPDQRKILLFGNIIQGVAGTSSIKTQSTGLLLRIGQRGVGSHPSVHPIVTIAKHRRGAPIEASAVLRLFSLAAPRMKSTQ